MTMKHKAPWLWTLLSRSSAVALAVGCGAGVAQVNKAFQGTGTVVSGDASISPGATAGTESIFVDSSAVIDWTPDDQGPASAGSIDFLPRNNVATFNSLGDFTVLNRIIPLDGNGLPVSRAIALNGTVQSEIGVSSPTTGGSVWFYSPGGIIAGANSVFNVGSLLLTTNAIDTSNGIDPNQIRFAGPAGSTSSVEVRAGAQINALNTGSYVALVAPRVVQGGTVTVNGSTAYVGAEAADIRINGGLFDIAITAGTTDANGVLHSGTTTAPTGTSDAQRVYMVAVPKNNALTMLLSGDIGYTPASAVAAQGGTVVLSAGYDVAGGGIGTMPNATATGSSGFTIEGSNWRNPLTGAATGDIVVRPAAGTQASFLGDVNLTAGRSILLRADATASILAAGSMDLTADASPVGGQIDLLTFGGSGAPATDGQITVAGALSLDADAFGYSGLTTPPLVGADTRGGTINVVATGGRIGAASLSADARADGGFGSDQGGSATGGSITIGAAGGTLNFGALSADVTARGGSGSSLSGSATGGGVTLYSRAEGGARGSFSVTGCANARCEVRAEGHGGYGVQGASGTGGSVLLYATDGDFTLPGAFELFAGGIGGSSDGAREGDATGGSVTVESRAGSAVMNFGNLHASATGGWMDLVEGPYFNSGDGGTGTGGIVNVTVAGGSFTASRVDADTAGIGGSSDTNCVECSVVLAPYQAGTGQGGTSNFLITGGSATIGALSLIANGSGGVAAAAYDISQISSIAGVGRGGSATLESRGGTLNLTTLAVEAGGSGGLGGSTYNASAVDGGSGFGGTAQLITSAGSTGALLVSGGVEISAFGRGGDGGSTSTIDISGNFASGAGGGATGGTAIVTLAGGSLTTPSLVLSAEATGGAGGDNGSDGAAGVGGSGTGGMARFSYLSEGHAIGSVTVTAAGQGGQAGRNGFGSEDSNSNPIFIYGTGAGGAGGAGLGGTAALGIDVDPSFTDLIVSADGIGSAGGGGATGAAGGAGTGGVASLDIDFGTTDVSGILRVTASGVGGAGGAGYGGSGGRGGDAYGGSARLALAGSSTQLEAGNLSVFAEALGGAGGGSGLNGGTDLAGADGGDALGGAALFAIGSGATAVTGNVLRISGDATGGAGSAGTAGSIGGAGGAGGDGSAGSATLRISDGRLTLGGSLTQPPGYTISANGRGGLGADGAGAGAAGAGGDGSGGQALFDAANGDYALGDLAILANGIAGLGGAPGGISGQSSGGAASFINGDSGTLVPGARRQLASLFMSANGATGGQISFADVSSALNGGLNVTGAVTLQSLGAAVPGFSGIAVSATNPVRIGGSAMFTSDGPLSFSFGGSGGLAASGALSGYSATGITLSHSARPAGSYSLSGDSIHLSTPGRISILGGGLRAADRLTLLSPGGDLTLGSGTLLDAGGDLRLFMRGSLLGAGATVQAGDSAAIGVDPGADILLATLLSGGLLDQADASGNALGAGGIALGGDFTVTGALGIGAGSGTLSAATIAIGTLTADRQQLTAANGVTIGNAVMTGDLAVDAGAGALSIGDATAGGNVALAGQGIALQRLVAGGTTLLAAGAGSLTGNDILSAGAIRASGASIALGSSGAMTIAQADATAGPLQLNAAGALRVVAASAAGSMTLGGATIDAAALNVAGALNATATGTLTVGTALAGGAMTLGGTTVDATALDAVGALNATAAGAAGFGAVTSRSGDIVLGAGGLLSLSGAIRAGAITLRSGDVAIANSASIGTLTGTSSIAFQSINSGQPAYLGGGDVAGAYSLSAAEIARVAAANIALQAPRQGIAGTPDLIVRDLTLGTALAGGGTLSLSTSGRLRVEGALRLTGRTGQGGATLSAGEAIEVISGAGLVELTDGNGALAGLLTLDSPTVIAATLDAIADVNATSSLVARDLRLAQNDGVVSDGGLLRAGTIQAFVTEGLFIQNSGLTDALADRRGFTAGNVLISTQGAATQIAINGQLLGAAAAFVTGKAAIPLISINGVPGGQVSGYAVGSKINGCLIASPALCSTVSFDSRDTWEGLLDPSVSVSRIFSLSLIELRDIVAQGYPPLIDEPVTGAGNEDLWERRCGGPDEPECGSAQ
ncbi:beta strand repeat-containing protein [Sphingobium bisphenolivorans]|uniref:beta strand repeat-containing protein n=1 Tax=Sphingobium bisphenolivorans TaxID=1335760 RepID=UPI0003A41E53|nr:hypothetical protein [Sphingobium bisphenolivorans]